ncbi:MAG: histidinol-phosphate transaminase [Dehalococcoidia bacterium]|jgi:histidinol-phosphate/aromatic aminotransferase/cobyric acid decarboxylase-like protein|nr:histidinol-phosphate transaminase [Dehalococcoidia bacterium]
MQQQQDAQYISSLYGGFWSFDVKDFCYMTNPYFPPNEFIDSLRVELRDLVKSYPSTNWYLSSLAAEPLGVTHEELVLANGASELINTITDRFVKHLAVPIPTFDEFINRATTQGKLVSTYQLEGNFELDVEGFIQHVKDSRATAALIINPNNPTGTVISQQSVWRLLESLRHLDVIVLDESFIDFVSDDPPPSAMTRLRDFPNLIVLKSLSKTYGIPGLRLGYAVSGNRYRIAELRSHLPIWGINSLAQFFLEHIGEYQQQFTNSCDDVKGATQALFSGLQGISYLHPYPTKGNFVLSRLLKGFTATELTTRLFEDFRILINDCSRKKGLDGSFVRMASRTVEENAQLVQALQALDATIPMEEGTFR